MGHLRGEGHSSCSEYGEQQAKQTLICQPGTVTLRGHQSFGLTGVGAEILDWFDRKIPELSLWHRSVSHWIKGHCRYFEEKRDCRLIY
jgi:hypothetical protein